MPCNFGNLIASSVDSSSRPVSTDNRTDAARLALPSNIVRKMVHVDPEVGSIVVTEGVEATRHNKTLADEPFIGLRS